MPVFAYIDGHRKPVYSDDRLPRGLIGRTGAILGCRALVLLHDAQGHPLLATTHRGDQHLTVGLPQIVARHAQARDAPPLAHLVVDREGMSGDFLAALVAAVKRQLELPVASLKTSDDGDETEAPTVCVTLPSFLCAWPPVEALRVRALQGGCRAASFPSSIVHGWLTLSLREEMHHVKRHVTLRSCWRQAAGTREAAAAGLPPRGSCPAPSDRE